MKIIIHTIFLLLSTADCIAQSTGINTIAPDGSAALEIKSTVKGLLIPRMSSAARMAIPAPATGLLIYDSSADAFWYRNNSKWLEMSTHSAAWRLDGNANTNPAYNFLGTTDNQPLRFRLANNRAGEFNQLTHNYSLGVFTGKSNSTGNKNIAMGDRALFSNTEGNNNIAIGQYALFDNINNGFNYNSGGTAIGTDALLHSTGYENTAAGAYALSENVSGKKNTALGYNANVGSMHNLYYATVIGANSFVNCDYCIVLGGTTFNGSHTYVGINTKNPAFSLDINEINNTGIALRHPSDNSGNNVWEIYHAPSPYANLPSQAGDLILFYNNTPLGGFDHSSGAYFSISDERMKKTIQPMQAVKEKIKLLKASAYEYINNNPAQRQSIGFIAQDIENIFPQLVYHNSDEKNSGEMLTLDYSGFGVLAIKGVQEQQEMIERHQKQIDELKRQIELLIKNK
ncbi:MAG: tail fiber domain-containing protein [Ferruginibacter sp.]